MWLPRAWACARAAGPRRCLRPIGARSSAIALRRRARSGAFDLRSSLLRPWMRGGSSGLMGQS
eukprot:12500064-Alexandrium_andersonii.AAC.1